MKHHAQSAKTRLAAHYELAAGMSSRNPQTSPGTIANARCDGGGVSELPVKMAEGPTTILEVQHMLIESAADLRRGLDGQVEAAAHALETLQTLENKETFDPGDRAQWVAMLSVINIARMKFDEAAKELHSRLNDYDEMLADLEQEAAEKPDSEKGRE